jgi:hypothetical protein
VFVDLAEVIGEDQDRPPSQPEPGEDSSPMGLDGNFSFNQMP